MTVPPQVHGSLERRGASTLASMSELVAALVDPWRLEIIAVVRNSHSAAERRALSRDTEHGRLARIGQGAYVERIAFESLTPEGQHIVRMRAVAAVAVEPIVFSHFSAAVLHGLPVLRSRLIAVHTVVDHDDDRHRHGTTTHHFLVGDGETVRFGELIATGVGRTVVDIAGAAPFEEGVVAADGALAAGVPRAMLEAAIDLAGPRRASKRIGEVVAFAHPGGESAAESRWRVTSMRLGVEIPELQHPVRLEDGSRVFLDGRLPRARIGIEVDGDTKFLDADKAPDGAGAAVVKEKRREDEVRAGLAGLVRLGWVQSGSTALLRAAYTRAGVRAVRPRPTLADHAEIARSARPRRPPGVPRWRA